MHVAGIWCANNNNWLKMQQNGSFISEHLLTLPLIWMSTADQICTDCIGWWVDIAQVMWDGDGCWGSGNSISQTKLTIALCSRWIEEVHKSFECVILQNRHQLLYFTFDVPSTEFKAINVQVRYDAYSMQPQLLKICHCNTLLSLFCAQHFHELHHIFQRYLRKSLDTAKKTEHNRNYIVKMQCTINV